MDEIKECNHAWVIVEEKYDDEIRKHPGYCIRCGDKKGGEVERTFGDFRTKLRPEVFVVPYYG